MTGRGGPDPDRRNDIVLTTERLTLDLPIPDDAASLFGLVGGDDRSQICQHLIWDGPDFVADMADWIERNHDARYADWGFHWTIRDRTGELSGSEGAALGSIGTRPLGPPGRADVGYWLGVPYWRRGVMSEALRAVLDLGFGELRYQKVEAEVFADNQAGRALVESVGMVLEGVSRRSIQKYGEWIDAAHYGILWEEWEPEG